MGHYISNYITKLDTPSLRLILVTSFSNRVSLSLPLQKEGRKSRKKRPQGFLSSKKLEFLWILTSFVSGVRPEGEGGDMRNSLRSSPLPPPSPSLGRRATHVSQKLPNYLYRVRKKLNSIHFVLKSCLSLFPLTEGNQEGKKLGRKEKSKEKTVGISFQ